MKVEGANRLMIVLYPLSLEEVSQLLGYKAFARKPSGLARRINGDGTVVCLYSMV